MTNINNNKNNTNNSVNNNTNINSSLNANNAAKKPQQRGSISKFQNKRNSTKKRVSILDLIKEKKKEILANEIVSHKQFYAVIKRPMPVKNSSAKKENKNNINNNVNTNSSNNNKEILEDNEGVKYIVFTFNHLSRLRKNLILSYNKRKISDNKKNGNKIIDDKEIGNYEEMDDWRYKEFCMSHQVSITLKAIFVNEVRSIKNCILVIHNNKAGNDNKNKNINIDRKSVV